MIGNKVARYHIVSALGQGGLATVWKANDQLLGRTVALKVLAPKLAASHEARRRFLHEAQAAAALDHPGIVAVYDAGETGEAIYIALALIDGETLAERLRRGPLAVAEALMIVRAAAEAIGHAHARSVIHRDVTSRNIMITKDERVVVLDFGLALAAWASRVTPGETIVGTAAYMAPEVMLGRKADARADVYGLGVVLYEALTGAFPHVGDGPQAAFYSTPHLSPTPPRERRTDLSSAVEDVVLKAIARDPDDRFQTAEEFVSALDHLSREP